MVLSVQKYTAEFRNTWSPLSVAVGMLVTSASCWCAAIGLLCRRLEDRTSRIRCTSSDFIKLSLCLACISAAFWSCSLWWEHHLVVRQAQLPPRFKWDLLWLPATPLAMCVLSKHVVESTSDMSLAVRNSPGAPITPFPPRPSVPDALHASHLFHSLSRRQMQVEGLKDKMYSYKRL